MGWDGAVYGAELGAFGIYHVGDVFGDVPFCPAGGGDGVRGGLDVEGIGGGHHDLLKRTRRVH